MIIVWMLPYNGAERKKITFDSAGAEDLELVAVVRDGETYHENALEQACRYLECVRDAVNGVLLSNVTAKTNRKDAGQGSGRLADLSNVKQVLKLPGCLRGAVLCADAVREDMEHRRSASGSSFFQYAAGLDELDICRILCRKGKAAYVKKAYFNGKAALPELGGFCREWLDGDWYLQTADRCRKFLQEMTEADGRVPLFAQAQALFVLKNCFLVNMGNKNKAALTDDALEQFLALCRSCLQKIDNALITAEESVHTERRILYAAWSALMGVKYAGREDEILRADTGFLPPVTLDLMEYESGIWRIDCSADRFVTDHLTLEVRRNGKTIPYRRTARFGGTGFFGKPLAEKDPFVLELPVAEMKAEETITFVLTDGRVSVEMPVQTVDYESKLTKMLKQSYWCFGDYMVTFRRGQPQYQIREEKASGRKAAADVPAAEASGREPAVNASAADLQEAAWPGTGRNEVTGIHLQRAGRRQRLRRECALLKEILRAPYGSKQMFVMRVLYWLTYPVYARKNIWLTFDKLYKGGDCGEYFYKYMMTRRKDGITPAYIIRENTEDCTRLKKEGFHPLIYRTWKQRLMYLHASMIFATHSSVHAFCGFTRWEIRFVQDRLKAANTCIQHGLSVQDLTADSNRIINNNKRYYCASRYEVENLSKPEYDYEKEVLRLTGIPRYDGLVNRRRKEVLIAPTWRAYIAMPSAMGTARPYNPDFKNTDYFKIFQELLENERLKETAGRTGYKLVYLLHPVISAQKEDFHVGGNVELRSATECSYEQLLTESSLMVTDYSGVQFDFAYMRKPIVYFHPPKLPPHYAEGGFCYDTQGFGEICTETEQLAEVLCDYLETGCALKEFYRKRQDDFFAFGDLENCRRIFEDAKEYQKERCSEQ